MDFILGALSTAAFFVCLYGAYTLGKRSRKSVQQPVDEDTIRKAKKMQKDFQELMNYDVAKALSGKKVT